MAKPGRKPKPALQVVREGNPGHRPVRQGVKIAPLNELAEPKWPETFPPITLPRMPRPLGKRPTAEARLAYRQARWERSHAQARQRELVRLRAIASREWCRVVPVLKHTAGLTAVDVTVLHDYCVCVARIDQCERGLSHDGLLMLGERGWQKNGLTTIVGQYRGQLRSYIGELGLSPSARTHLDPPDGSDDDDDSFD